MKYARIYQPTKNAMQSGKAREKQWRVEVISDNPTFTDPIMGWIGSDDMYRQELRRAFASKEEAIRFAERNGFVFDVVEPEKSSFKIKSYSDNFKYKPPC